MSLDRLELFYIQFINILIKGNDRSSFRPQMVYRTPFAKLLTGINASPGRGARRLRPAP